MEITTQEITTAIENLKNNKIEDVIKWLEDYVEVPKMMLFSASVLYNHGLGNQIKELPQFKCATMDEAMQIATRSANKILGEDKWKEVKPKIIGIL